MGRELAKTIYLQVPISLMIKESNQLGKVQDLNILLSLEASGVSMVEIFIGDKEKGTSNV